MKTFEPGDGMGESAVTTSFRVGRGIGIAYDSTLALFEPLNGALAESLWALVAKGAGIDELLEELSSTGLRALGSFAMAQFEETQTRIVVRGGALIVIEGAFGCRKIGADGVRTWVEEVVEGVDGVELSLAEPNDGPLPFRVERGLLPADVLRHGKPMAPALKGVALDWVDDFSAGEVLTGTTPATGPDPATEPEPAAPANVSEPAALPDPHAPVPVAGVAAPVIDPGRTMTSVDFGEFSEASAIEQVPPPIGAPVAEQEPTDDVDAYDEIYGRTMVRSVHSAAVHLVEDDAADAPSTPTVDASAGLIQGIPGVGGGLLGDHDGRTMTKAQIAALRAAQSGAAAAPAVVSSMGGPTVQALLCPNQHANPPQLTTCRVCHTSLMAAPVHIARPVLGTLRFTDGTTVSLDRPVLIGRNPKVETGLAGEIPQVVRLDVGPGLSRTHAVVRLEGWQVLLEDLNSANGTIVRLPGREPRRLHPGEPVLLEVGADVDLGGEINCVFDS
jgi:hypothetical protein